MRLLSSLVFAGLLLSTAAAHSQIVEFFGPDDRPPPPPAYEPAPPPEPDLPPRRMVCTIDAPFPFRRQCDTYPGYPGSPCRCFGSFFEGTRDDID